MSVGLDSEGLLAIYADWIAFLREKKGPLEGQLAKVQAKGGGGKEKTPPPPVVPIPTEPVVSPPQDLAAPTPVSEEAPGWLFEAAPVPEGEAVPGVSLAPEDEGDAWM